MYKTSTGFYKIDTGDYKTANPIYKTSGGFYKIDTGDYKTSGGFCKVVAGDYTFAKAKPSTTSPVQHKETILFCTTETRINALGIFCKTNLKIR